MRHGSPLVPISTSKTATIGGSGRGSVVDTAPLPASTENDAAVFESTPVTRIRVTCWFVDVVDSRKPEIGFADIVVALRRKCEVDSGDRSAVRVNL